jgi:hypothetical protein
VGPTHAPPLHAIVHGEPVPFQAPEVLQVCGCAPLQRVVPGTQLPPHAPPAAPVVPMHASGQVAGAPHCPSAPQVCSCVSLAHAEVPGTQLPPHAPPGMPTLPVQAYWHVVAAAHWPSVPHACSCVSLAHAVVPGTHTPPQAPPAAPTVPVQA